MLSPNGQHMIDAFIIQSGVLLDSVIVNKKIDFSEMPGIQLSALLLDHDIFFEKIKNN